MLDGMDKRNIFNHPEVENYGLNSDMQLWAEFNKELHIRNWVKSSRNCLLFRDTEHPDYGTIEFDAGAEWERKMADRALDDLIDKGYLNPYTYLKTEKAFYQDLD